MVTMVATTLAAERNGTLHSMHGKHSMVGSQASI